MASVRIGDVEVPGRVPLAGITDRTFRQVCRGVGAALAVERLRLSVRAKGERRGVIEMRRHLAAYVQGPPGADALRERPMAASDAGRVEGLLRWVLEQVEQGSFEEVRL